MYIKYDRPEYVKRLKKKRLITKMSNKQNRL